MYDPSQQLTLADQLHVGNDAVEIELATDVIAHQLRARGIVPPYAVAVRARASGQLSGPNSGHRSPRSHHIAQQLEERGQIKAPLGERERKDMEIWRDENPDGSESAYSLLKDTPAPSEVGEDKDVVGGAPTTSGGEDKDVVDDLGLSARSLSPHEKPMVLGTVEGSAYKRLMKAVTGSIKREPVAKFAFHTTGKFVGEDGET